MGFTKGWLRYAKGGTYQPFFSESPLVVRWKGDGEEINAFSAPLFGTRTKHVTNTQYFDTPGLTYSTRTRNQISPSFWPSVLALTYKVHASSPMILAKSP